MFIELRSKPPQPGVECSTKWVTSRRTRCCVRCLSSKKPPERLAHHLNVQSYFTKDFHRGVCVFRRRPTTEVGHRGYRLSSLGILLAKSARPRPWKHLPALKELVTTIYSKLENNDTLEPTDGDWEPAREFFNDRKVKRADLGGAGDWNGWGYELSGVYASNCLHFVPSLTSAF
jgi:hypothetical protein